MRLGTPKLKNKFHKATENVEKFELTDANTFLIFPFELTMGYVNSTETGINSNNIRITDYSAFNRVFTGLENVIAQWQDAYHIYIKNADDTFLSKEYKVGKYFKGFITSEGMQATFEPSPIDNDFIQQTTTETITITTYDPFDLSDLYKLFVVPELKITKWLYVQSATRHFDSAKNYHHTTLTLTSLNSKIAKTGRAIEEFVSTGAPGEGYAYPSISSKNGKRKVVIDDIKKRDIPINSIQDEYQGPAGVSTFYCYGRPTIMGVKDGNSVQAFNPKIEPPRLLLNYKMESPTPSALNTKPNAETDFFILKEAEPTLEVNLNDWKEQVKNTYNMSQRSVYDGVLQSHEKLADIELTNPIVGGTRSHILWDKTFKTTLIKNYNTNTNALSTPTIKLNGDYSIPDILNHNIFITSHLSSLPLTEVQNVSWTSKSLPIIGGIVTKLSLGVPWGWNNQSVRVQGGKLLMVMPASIVLYGQALLDSGNKVIPANTLKIEMGIFKGNDQAENIEYSGVNATGTIFKYELTHLFSKVIGNETYTFDTLDLGQEHPKTDINGTNIAGTHPLKLYWDETCKAVKNTITPGYVIDLFGNRVLAKLNHRISFFTNNIPVWHGSFQSNSMFTTNIRDWSNQIKFSNWQVDHGVLKYPKDIVAPDPPGSNYALVKIDNPLFMDFGGRFYDPLLIDKGANYIQPHIISSTTPKTSSFEYDLAKIGGTANLKRNYEKINFNLNFGHVYKQNISLDIPINKFLTQKIFQQYFSLGNASTALGVLEQYHKQVNHWSVFYDSNYSNISGYSQHFPHAYEVQTSFSILLKCELVIQKIQITLEVHAYNNLQKHGNPPETFQVSDSVEIRRDLGFDNTDASGVEANISSFQIIPKSI